MKDRDRILRELLDKDSLVNARATSPAAPAYVPVRMPRTVEVSLGAVEQQHRVLVDIRASANAAIKNANDAIHEARRASVLAEKLLEAVEYDLEFYYKEHMPERLPRIGAWKPENDDGGAA